MRAIGLLDASDSPPLFHRVLSAPDPNVPADRPPARGSLTRSQRDHSATTRRTRAATRTARPNLRPGNAVRSPIRERGNTNQL